MSKVGVYRTDITPPLGMPFIGYHRPNGIRNADEHIYATAFVFEANHHKAVLIGMLVDDTTTIRTQLRFPLLNKKRLSPFLAAIQMATLITCQQRKPMYNADIKQLCTNFSSITALLIRLQPAFFLCHSNGFNTITNMKLIQNFRHIVAHCSCR
jgi:hypothetical protein